MNAIFKILRKHQVTPSGKTFLFRQAKSVLNSTNRKKGGGGVQSVYTGTHSGNDL